MVAGPSIEFFVVAFIAIDSLHFTVCLVHSCPNSRCMFGKFLEFIQVLAEDVSSVFVTAICVLKLYLLLFSHRFRNELPDPSAQPKLMTLKRDKDRFVVVPV